MLACSSNADQANLPMEWDVHVCGRDCSGDNLRQRKNVPGTMKALGDSAKFTYTHHYAGFAVC